MKTRKILAILVLALGSVAHGSIHLTMNNLPVDSAILKVGQSCTVEVISDSANSYVANIGFDNGVVLGNFLYSLTQPEAGSQASVVERDEPTFYGYYVNATGITPPSPGVHFIFQYEAQQLGQTELRLYDETVTSVIDSVQITTVPAEMGTAFTYQGRLLDENAPADGLYDFQFSLYDGPDPNVAMQQKATIEVEDQDVIDGYFIAELDFGSDVFTGDACWLETAVRPGDSVDPEAFVSLSPLQKITPVPYALQTRGIFVDNAGKVGIGTASPAYKLHVVGKCISGADCRAGGGYATVGGGLENDANGYIATVSGGGSNEASGYLATVSGGYNNTARWYYDTVSGGYSNEASGYYATVSGGLENDANGYAATVSGGKDNTASGDYSFAAGHQAKALHEGVFVWADSTSADFASTGENQFLIRAHGGVGIYTSDPRGYRLCVEGSAAKSVGGSSWATFSDARLKDVHGDYGPGLSEVCRLTPVRYSYKQDNDQDLPAENESVGVVAQQVRAVLPEAVEENSDGYLMVNNDPIIWAMVNAIKELNAENDAHTSELRAENDRLRKEIGSLTARLQRLETIMGKVYSDSIERVMR